VLHGLIGVPAKLAVQVIVRLPVVGLSTTWVICQDVNRAPSLTERSLPFQMMPRRSVSRPLCISATVSNVANALELWQSVQSVDSFIASWKSSTGSASQTSCQNDMSSWQLKQPSGVTGMALAAASAASVLWQTLQLVRYVG